MNLSKWWGKILPILPFWGGVTGVKSISGDRFSCFLNILTEKC